MTALTYICLFVGAWRLACGVLRLVDKLEELEDLQNVYHTMDITDEIAEALDE